MTKQDGGPAFPNLDETLQHGDMLRFQPGMSLRDWFAGQALAGFASNCDEAGLMAWRIEDMARDAYKTADAMLAARDGK